MQTILGANGQIANVLARELKQKFNAAIRLVSRNPKRINFSDMLLPANLIDAQQTMDAVKGSKIAYLTIGLAPDTAIWQEIFPVLMRNVINACKHHSAKLVFFDNTYMYPQNDDPLTEETTFAPVGKKGKVRAQIASMLLYEIESKNLEAVICRAPEFYGPDKTKSITNTLIYDNIVRNKKLKVPIADNTLRTLIWTPDASRATALIGNTPDAYNQTWHLPCDDNRLTYKQFIEEASKAYGRPLNYTILKRSLITIGGIFNNNLYELCELLPRYKYDNIFNSSKFKKRFPEFRVTTYREGIELLIEEISKQKILTTLEPYESN